MSLEPQHVVRQLALEEAARVASRDRDDGQVGQQRGADVRHRDIVAQRISPNARQLAVGRPDPFWQNSLAMPQPADRPLSPHLQVYRPMYTMVLSILHRASGLYLSACGFLFVAWISAAALGPDAYACVTSVLASAADAHRARGARSRHSGITCLPASATSPGTPASASRRRRRAGPAPWSLSLAAAACAATLLLTPAGRFLAGSP